MTSAGGSVTNFFQQLQAGDRTAAEELWQRFFPRLLGLARKTLSGRQQRVADADDAMQSAFISFWQRAERGDFADDLDRNDLWNILGVITIRKAQKQLRREAAQKRGGGRQREEFGLEEALSRLPSADMDLICEELIGQLDPELREFALLRLMGYKNREIAAQFGCTERKVERKLQLIRAVWEDANE